MMSRRMKNNDDVKLPGKRKLLGAVVNGGGEERRTKARNLYTPIACYEGGVFAYIALFLRTTRIPCLVKD